MLYRGQAYGDPIGEWWTTSKADAEKFAMSAGGNRTWIVLGLDEDLAEEWLQSFLYVARDPSDERGSWYRIPVAELAKRWRGVRIVGGAIALDESGQTIQSRR